MPQIWQTIPGFARKLDPVRGKLWPLGRGGSARTAEPSYNVAVAATQGDLRRDTPEVTSVEIRAAAMRSAQEPTEATHGRLDAAHERRRNLRLSGRGGYKLHRLVAYLDLKP